MNKEEIEELKEFTIDFTDIDELSLGLEICSQKSNMVIQEFTDTIIQLQQEIKQLKERIDKLTAESTEWEERTYYWQDKEEHLQQRINKAIKYIENKLWLHFETRSEYLTVRDNLLEILKGNNNE